MKISYAVTVCNELDEIKKLIPFLIENKQPQDDIVVLYDNNAGSEDVVNYLCTQTDNIDAHFSNFNGHFANWKNLLTTHCKGDYIFQIDADEIPHKTLMENIHQIIEMNDVDVILVPRVNTVTGLTQEHIEKWKWMVNENGWVNWPDPQWRIYKNVDYIKWKNKVHEKLDGYKTISNLPMMEELSLHHPKTIEKQEKQNKFYETL
tara:strand:+ start:116 stop:730 length:615 start_codon:yes stop_codon:yes gene_type:complete